MSSKAYATIGTALVCLVAVLWMACSHLRMAREAVPQRQSQIVVDDEFVDLMEMPLSPNFSGDDDALAQAENPDTESQPLPESGTDIDDAGRAGVAPPVVSQKHESTVKERDRAAEEAAAAAERKRQEEERIRREANNQISNAFDNAVGKHNTAQGDGDKGNTGVSSGENTQGTHSGRGTGTAGKGWGLPSYSDVLSPVTGTVEMNVTFDANGQVTDVKFTGGTPPAATNTAVRAACEAEVRRHRFIRTATDPATEGSRAIITYKFR